MLEFNAEELLEKLAAAHPTSEIAIKAAELMCELDTEYWQAESEGRSQDADDLLELADRARNLASDLTTALTSAHVCREPESSDFRDGDKCRGCWVEGGKHYKQVPGSSGVYLIVTDADDEIIRDDRPWQMKV